MKLTYWVAESYENQVFSIRGKRRRDVVEELHDQGYDPKDNNYYAPPHKVEVEYDNVFDLLQMCLGEGRVYEGSEADLAAAQAYDAQLQQTHVSIVKSPEFETLEGVPDDEDEDEREYGPHDPDWYATA